MSEISSSFLYLAEGHANAVAKVKVLRQRRMNCGHNEIGGDLTLAIAREEETLAALISSKPRSNIEAQLKLLYVVHYLISTRTSLDDQEMGAIIQSIAHLRED